MFSNICSGNSFRNQWSIYFYPNTFVIQWLIKEDRIYNADTDRSEGPNDLILALRFYNNCNAYRPLHPRLEDITIDRLEVPEINFSTPDYE